MFQHIDNKLHESFLGRPANLNGHSDKPIVFRSHNGIYKQETCGFA